MDIRIPMAHCTMPRIHKFSMVGILCWFRVLMRKKPTKSVPEEKGKQTRKKLKQTVTPFAKSNTYELAHREYSQN
jgi:hypothetical protein